MASALDLADGGPVRLSLKGTSPLADWTGDLRASVGNLGTLDCRVGWVLNDGVRVRADGVIRAHESYLARPPWILIGEEARFGAEVELGPGDVLAVRRATVTGHDASFDFSGRLEEGSGAVSSAFHLTLTRLEALAGVGDGSGRVIEGGRQDHRHHRPSEGGPGFGGRERGEGG